MNVIIVFADRGNNRGTGWCRLFLCARRTVQDRDFFRGDLEGDARESDNGSLVNEPQRVVARCQRRIALRLRFCPRDLSGQRRIQIKGCTIRCPRRRPPRIDYRCVGLEVCLYEGLATRRSTGASDGKSRIKLRADRAEFTLLLNQLRHECGPAGLMRRAEASASVAMEVFVKPVAIAVTCLVQTSRRTC